MDLIFPAIARLLQTADEESLGKMCNEILRLTGRSDLLPEDLKFYLQKESTKEGDPPAGRSWDELNRKYRKFAGFDENFYPYYPNCPAGVSFRAFDSLYKKKEEFLPLFPVESLPPVIREYAQSVSESIQVPIDMVCLDILAALAVCVQGRFAIRLKKDHVEDLNLYCLLIARPSERKSAVLSETRKPICDFVKEWNLNHEDEYNKYTFKKTILERKIKRMKDAFSRQKDDDTADGNEFIQVSEEKGGHTEYSQEFEEEEKTELLQSRKQEMKPVSLEDMVKLQKELKDLEKSAAKPLRIFADDITPEALASKLLDNNERIGIFSAEGGIMDKLAGQYSNHFSNLDLVLKGYYGEEYTVDRVGRDGECLEHPLITFLLNVQPVTLLSMMENVQFRGRGFLARFLYSMPKSLVGNRIYNSPDIQENLRENYSKLIKELLTLSVGWKSTPELLNLDEDAFIVFNNFFNEIEPELPKKLEDIEDWGGKIVGTTARIAGILHVVKNRYNSSHIPVCEQTMKEAVLIGKYFIEHTMAAFDVFGMYENKNIQNAKTILKKLEKSHFWDNKTKWDSGAAFEPSCTVRDIERLNRSIKKDDLIPALEILENHGYIKIVKKDARGDNGGRSSLEVYFNPEYLRHREEGNEL